ncbi:MAG TPA: CmpA/NrtA family ABC transporter substrate-binding protein [Verrucomicrobiae bacterium]|nr:CmpA/NrtA family ABC transporter substrate-binding protein [Verrucomicrobiae bacterium]
MAKEIHLEINKRPTSEKKVAPQSELRVGFVPLTDCAPLVMAQALGLFHKYGLQVRLRRELGWATIRDKIIQGELEAAHALAAMPLAVTLGLGSIRCDCLTGLVLNLHGNAITLSRDLWQRGVRDVNTLRDEIARSHRERTLTFGAVFSFSSHRHLLRKWLSGAGINPDRNVRIVIVPPPQMAANLQSGNLDGFCVGEPWNSAAVQMRAGWCAAVSAELDPGHPEKVLMVRREFAEKREEEHLALLAALLDACEYCAAPENHEEIITTLARPEYVDAPAALLRRSLSGPFDLGSGAARAVRNFCVFHGPGVNEPTQNKAAWAFELVRASGLCPNPSALHFDITHRVYRPQIFSQAQQFQKNHQHDSIESTNPYTNA